MIVLTDHRCPLRAHRTTRLQVELGHNSFELLQFVTQLAHILREARPGEQGDANNSRSFRIARRRFTEEARTQLKTFADAHGHGDLTCRAKLQLQFVEGGAHIGHSSFDSGNPFADRLEQLMPFEHHEPDQFGQQQQLNAGPQPLPRQIEILRRERDHDCSHSDRARRDRDRPIAPRGLV
jgi:hypothetical protein